ncbi:MAG: hypothetical protein ACM31C_34780 [Acidobacteriota bacterium]
MRGLLAVTAMVVAVGSAHADDQPWAAGVTDAQRQTAQHWLDIGNAQFLDKRYADALESYQKAIAAWDHPAIRFNIVRCLIQLERTVEASDNLALALKYGSAPLQEAVYSEALAYQKLLANQIGELEVSCTQPDVQITLDGKRLATCPASSARRLVPGEHQLVATKNGFLTKSLDVIVLGGKHQKVSVALDPLEKAARLERRWPVWVPWVVFGGGAATLALGGALELKARSDIDTFDSQIAHDCAMLACDPNQLSSLDSTARLEGRLAAVTMAAGAASAIAGGVMLYLNRARTVYPTVEVVPHAGGAVISVGGQL